MRLPKCPQLFFPDQLVVRVSGSGLLEWRSSSVHYKKNNSCCENIDFSPFVFLVKNFRSHVALSSQFSLKDSLAVSAFEEAGKAKVCYFEDKCIREKEVFWFDIAMCVALLVHVVDSIHHLVKVCSCDLLRELASVCYKVKQLSSSRELQHKCEAVACKLLSGLEDGVLPDTDQLDEVVVVQVLHGMQLIFHIIGEGGELFEFFEGHAISLGIECLIHAALVMKLQSLVARPELLDYPELVQVLPMILLFLFHQRLLLR